MASFVHLHVHSPFSFLDGASRIEDLVQAAAELGMPAMAVTDHSNASAAVQFHQAALAVGIKPIQGAEVTLEGGHHLVLLAQDAGGYANLCRVLTQAHLSHPRRQPRVSLEALPQCNRGLIALSGCRRGEVPALILQDRYREAEDAARKYMNIFGPGSFFLELQHLHLPGERTLNRRLAELAEHLNLEPVASNNVHYTRRHDFIIHDLLTCVRTLTRLKEVHPERRLNRENYLKSPEEMAVEFPEHPRALANTLAVAERCRPVLDFSRRLHPRFPLPPGTATENFLRDLVYRGAGERYRRLTPEVTARLEHELNIINRLGYADYFLLVWDLVNYARQERIRCAGRGSAADSAVAYCLYITEVDPIGRRLLFERFMSLERAEKPDIDIDFDARHRDRVANYLYQKYGADYVASVATYNTFHARGAVRDLGKAMDLPPDVTGRLSKLLPHIPADHIRTELERLPELRANPLPGGRDYQLLLDACAAVAGFPRFLGTHLGGLVVGREPLVTLTPLQEAAKGVVVTQFDKDDVEDLGLVKLDLLSLRTMSAIEDAVIHIREQAPDFDYEAIPLDDPGTYEMLGSGRTIGSFQLESPAQRALQARLGATGLEDVINSIALIRPGPIKGNMVEPFVARRQGLEPVTYLHPKLRPILEKTYGVVLFQEQVIEIATAIANFTPGEADRLRRVMTHARSHREMADIGQHFIAKAVENGVDPQVAETVFSYIRGYASYGFCEAHAAAFATTAYKTAYLVRHHPAEFFAALLSHQPMGYYPVNTLVVEARRRGVAVLPPDINKSRADFTVEGGAIRVSLRQVKGLSTPSIRSLLAAREERPFSSPADLCARTTLARDELENLIRCGALDKLHPHRRQMLWLLPQVLAARCQISSFRGNEPGKKQKAESVSALQTVWDLPPGLTPPPEMPDFSEAEKRDQEYELLDMDVHRHYMSYLRERLNREGFLASSQLSTLKDGAPVRVAGLVIRPHRPPTKSGRTVVFLSLEDEFGLTDVTVFEHIYQRYGRFIFAVPSPPLAVEGRVSRRGNAVSVTAHRLWPLKAL
ncbi:DNA polymerase [Clostridiales bacterium PH28_bin88]|nr:DNA polymerase [Clostridiales bacterium PH28_bin88]